jgi:Fe-S-cluster containining protein
MDRATAFSYACNGCGLCCHGKVITLSPYDVIRIARAAQLTTGEAVARFTLRRGSILRFLPNNSCAALEDSRCTIHPGRPLACRLYPLGLERTSDGDRFARLEPAPGSAGVYGSDGTVDSFLSAQNAGPYLEAVRSYARLIPKMRGRIAALVDFDRVEPREFWRIATREATAESGFDPNPIISAMFDPDALGCARTSDHDTVAAHVAALEAIALDDRDGARIAAAAVMLAISLGYSPAIVRS